MSKSAVRIAIASNFGGEKSSVSCLRSCPEGLVRVQTRDADESVTVIENLNLLDGNVLFFQAYDVDDNGDGGSIIYVGGDHDFMNSAVLLIWWLSPGMDVHLCE